MSIEVTRVSVEAAASLVGAHLCALHARRHSNSSAATPEASPAPAAPAVPPTIPLAVLLSEFSRAVLLPTFISEGHRSDAQATFVTTLLCLRQVLIDNSNLPQVQECMPAKPIPTDDPVAAWASNVVWEASRLRHPPPAPPAPLGDPSTQTAKATPPQELSEEEAATKLLVAKIKEHDGNSPSFMDAWNNPTINRIPVYEVSRKLPTAKSDAYEPAFTPRLQQVYAAPNRNKETAYT
jgi:hypothetical protein